MGGSAEQFIAKLGKGRAVPAVLLLGSDLYLRDMCKAKLVEACVPESARAWAVTRFSLEETPLTQVLQQAQTLPMLSPQQVLFVSDLEALMRLGEERRAEAEAELAAYLEAPAPFTVLVLEAESLDQRTKLFKLLSTETLVVSVELVEGKGDDKRELAIQAAQRMIPGIAKDIGTAIDPDAAGELAEITNGELARIHTEMQKLATYAGPGRRITLADVESLVVADQKSSVWQLADMLAERRAAQAFEFIDRILKEGEQPVGLIGGMAWMYRKLLEAQSAPAGLRGFAAAGVLKMKPETAELALNASRKIPKERLLAGLKALYDADSNLKGGAPEPRVLLEFLVARLTA